MAEPSGRANIGKTCLVLNLKARSDKFAEIIEHRVSEDGLKEEYYVHYCGYDRRLDNWIPAEHLDLNVFPPEPEPEKEYEEPPEDDPTDDVSDKESLDGWIEKKEEKSRKVQLE